MINIGRLHEQFRLTVNRLDSNYNKSFSVSVIDSYLNKSQDVITERLMRHVDENTGVRNHLRVLERKEVPLKIVEKKGEYIVAGYPDDFFRLLRQNAMVKKKGCNEERKILVRTVKSDKLSEILKDPYWKPNFEWEETVGDQASKGYYVYIQSDWTVSTVVVDYMRKPKVMAAHTLSGCTPGEPYVLATGEVVKNDGHCEFSDTYLWRYIGDLAALFAMRDLGQVDDTKTKMEELIFSEIMII